MALDRDAPPVVAFVHDVLEPGVVSRWMRWSSLFRDRVERFLVPAEAVRPSLVAHGVADASIHVVPPAVDDVPALTADERRAVRRSVGVANDELVIGFVGQLEERKGVDVLLEAVELVALPARVTCVVVGDDPFGEHRRYRDAVVARARRMPQVRITGWRRDAARIIAACDVLVCPSRRDACPLSVLQAMSAGLAVVGTRVGGIPEQLGDSEAGLLIAAGDARELREAIDALLVDRALRERLGGAARERHRTRFAVARARAALGDALAGAVAARTRPREV
jgi:glycosyltransferase involved in cell wall biosynthesis